MANDGQIVFEVTADGKHAIADIKAITKAIQQETGKWDAAAKQATDGIEGKFSGLLKKLAAGFSTVKIAKALLDFGSAAVDAASDLREVQNVVDVTFGSNANKIETWSKNAASQFGLTETQAKKFSSTMGAMLKSSGMAGDQIVDISTDLAGLAADMASFYNLDFEEAFSKIRSGMSGMTMPLKELGIDMSVDTLNAYALAQGMEKTYSQMTQSEQTMLRYQYLMQATSDAQGDFARTSTEYANSTRTLENNIERVKTILGNSFIDIVTQAKNGLNEFINLLFPEKKTTVIDDFNAIDVDTESKLVALGKIKQEAEDTASILREIYGKGENEGEDEQGVAAAEVVAKYGVKSDETRAYLEKLGFSTEEIDTKQKDWLETCKRLVKVLPGLNEIINTETGEVKGGTQAIFDYIKAWEEGQTKLVMLGALEQKESALSSRFADLPGLQLDMALAERRVREQRKKIDALLKKYGRSGFDVYDESGRIKFNNPGVGLTDEEKEIFAALEAYNDLVDKQNEARESYKAQKDALEEAKIALEEYRQTIEEMPGDIDKAKSASDKFWEDSAEGIKVLVNAAAEAVKAMEDYATGVHEASEKAVNSVVHGLDAINYSTYKTTSTNIENVRKQLNGLKEGTDEWKEKHSGLEKELEKYNNQLITTDSIYKNLQSQADFLGDYLKNLRQAREMGLDENLLAELSDGSVESAQYLDAIVNSQTGTTVEQINEKYREITEAKAQLAEELANQQLSVDETYKSLADKAKEAVDALDQAIPASEKTGSTMQAIADAIQAHIPDVAAQVDGMLSELNRLNGYGISIDFGGFGKITFNVSSGETAKGSRMGLDFVPHDGYLARLHEGERVLTAQENEIWNALRGGGVAGFSLDDLGGVMRDNVKPGGNVYLDGKIVGSVVSDMQGKSYRQLKRSGWQS